MRVLVTGGSGFIGRNLVEQLSPRFELLAPRRQELDLLDGDAVRSFLRREPLDAIVHAATTPGHRNAGTVTDLALKNLRAFFHLALYAHPETRFVVLGSGAEYGLDRMSPRAKEEELTANVPADETGFSKMVISCFGAADPRFVCLRPFGVFGRYEDWEIRFISNAICKALFGLPITLRQNRKLDYVLVDDLVRVVEHFLTQPARHRSYNVTPPGTPDLLGLARLVREVSRKDLPIVVSKEGMGPEYTGDNARLTAEVPGLVYTPIREAVEGLYAWYQERRGEIRQELLLEDK